jgi:phosphoribosylformylglycinamidine cyclo-ligase
VIRPLLEPGLIKGMAHVTGGGVTENLPRILPPGVGAEIDRRTWEVPPIFRWLQATGGVPEADMFRAFNMGIGLIIACAEEHVETLLAQLSAAGEANAVRIGRITDRGEGVRYV